MNDWKFVILAAGLGTRCNVYKNLHKALLPVENIPIISRIINNVPEEIEIVIAVGYLKDQIISYLNFVYPNRKFTFVEVDPFSGPNSGPGISLGQCKNHLNCPFIFTSVDTLLQKEIIHEKPLINWIGVDKSEPVTFACLINGELKRTIVHPIFIGICGVFNWSNFFNLLEDSNTNEVTDAIENYTTKVFDWKDTGSNSCYELIKPSVIVPFKEDQIIFIDNNKVVKFFSDKKSSNSVYIRAKTLYKKITKINDHMIGYDFIKGELFTNLNKNPEKYTKLVFDKIYTNGTKKSKDFCHECDIMYKQKTESRINDLQKKYPKIDSILYVNDIKVKSIKYYLQNINWDEINKTSVASKKFHGDIQPENIIVQNENIIFIDWRGGFADNLDIGDMYYDFGKLWHGCLVSNQKILKDEYDVDIRGNKAYIKIEIKDFLKDCLLELEKLSKLKKLDLKKIKLLGALQYLTIASLYNNTKYATFLFLLGKMLLENLEYETSKSIKIIQR